MRSLHAIRLARIEALADQRPQVVAQRLRQLVVGHTGDVGVLDDVAGVDVVVVAIGPACRPMTKNTRAWPSGFHDGAHGCDVARPLGLDARGELVETLLVQRCASEASDLLAKAGTQALDVEAGDLRRGDDRAFRHDQLSDLSRPAAKSPAG